ncbi:MAG: hypothetical protein R2786_08485 [Flavobacteriaceae bacterium]
MLPKTNIETQLKRSRNRRTSIDSLISEVHKILEENSKERAVIMEGLFEKGDHSINNFQFHLLEKQHIFHITDIEKICVDYRLRFLDTHFFKGPIPEEAISKIRAIEKGHRTSLHNLKIMAPAKLLKLENADDPLLFAPMGNNYYYLIHKWGNDLHPLRKWLMWPYKTFENLVITLFFLSIILTAITPMQAFTKNPVTQTEYLLMFLFMFKAVAGIVLFYGFAKGKNFNTAIWNSKYYNG